MKNKGSLLLLVGLLLAGSVALAGDGTTLRGEYIWNNRDQGGELEAVFTPTGEGTWDVSFHFTFRGRAHVYSGTAEGSLSEGNLSGTVQNEEKRRTFTFEGAFTEGRFEGTHAEIEGGKPRETGTLTLGG